MTGDCSLSRDRLHCCVPSSVADSLVDCFGHNSVEHLKLAIPPISWYVCDLIAHDAATAVNNTAQYRRVQRQKRRRRNREWAVDTFMTTIMLMMGLRGNITE